MIRKATTKDLPWIMKLERDCFRTERFSEAVVHAMINRDDAFTLIAEDGGRVVGAAMCMFSTDAGEGKIASMGVLRNHRGRGLGSELLRACEDRFRSLGLSLFTLEVDVQNELAVRLYTSRGYRIKGVIEGFYSRGRDAYMMTKNSSR